ncbi:MAG: EF-Tu/IF-2/RF-3 family GTPase, partial [Candidatus Micrarchaeia archaeon]
MASLNIAILGEKPEARAAAAAMLGKKGAVDDLGFYHTVFQGKIVSAIDPAAYPAKLACMMQALGLVDRALVVADAPSAALGEAIVALDVLGMKAAFAGELDFAPFIEKTGLKGSNVFASVGEAKDWVLAQESARQEGEALAYIDHCFDVKGVGTVALGVVKRGAVRVHDKLKLMPSGRDVEVRSIQMNDADVKESFSGDRVGLCIKGVKSEEVGRGEVVCAAGVQVLGLKEFECEISAVRFLKEPIEAGVYHLSAG